MGMYTGKGRGRLIRKATTATPGVSKLGSGGGGGGGSVITDYNQLENKPKLNGNTLIGDTVIEFPSAEFMPQAYRTEVNEERYKNIPVGVNLGLFYEPTKTQINGDGEYVDGFIINIMNTDKSPINFSVHLNMNRAGEQGMGWIEWNYGAIASFERVTLLEDSPALS